MKKLLLLLPFLALPCFAQIVGGFAGTGTAGKTFAVLHTTDFTCAACTSSTVTVSARTAGALSVFLATNGSGPANYITSATCGGDTFTVPAGPQLNNNSIGATSGAYFLSGTGGGTSCTVNFPNGNYAVTYYELSVTGGTAAFDTSGASNASAGTSITGQALTLAGSGEVVFQWIRASSNISAITTYSNFTNSSLGTAQAFALLLNTASGAAPTWTDSVNEAAVVAAMAFK